MSNGNGKKQDSVVGEDIDAHSQPEEGRHEAGGAEIEQFRGKFGRYLDIDGDGIPYRTIPGAHLTQGAFTTRGSSRDEYAVYTEDGDAYKRNVDRLARKWETAKTLVPQPEFYQAVNQSPYGVVFFGTSVFAAEEAIDILKEEGITLDAIRVRAFPFAAAFEEFISSHEKVFVIEQNRDAQFRSLMMIEFDADPAKLISVLNYDGTPITADTIFKQIVANLSGGPADVSGNGNKVGQAATPVHTR